MSTNPGTIKKVVAINLSRPRHPDIRSSVEYGWIRHRLWELLQNGDAPEETGKRASQDVAAAISPSVVL
ncbi:hypothetical protein MOTE_04060 [Moorella thermoacetica]|uniref:Uncharacterized protein n=1 Tax=Neomoorella thermoacetica TaxID=1525 RepID=A0A1J5NYR7_NEOTH|nr:hypothetical protein MOTE_04060 [Moorella thermoacetica]